MSDREHDQIKREAGATVKSARKSTLQRQSTNEVKVDEVPPIVHDVLRSPGQPLDKESRAFFEPRFGHDFSNVRVHTDAKAAESARAVNALAYTVGKNIVFEVGKYDPLSSEGQKLLSHELIHSIQQSECRVISPSFPIDDAASTAEKEADSAMKSFTKFDGASKNQLYSYTSKSQCLQRQLSPELEGAPEQSLAIAPRNYSEVEMRVLAWLHDHKDEIVSAEQFYRVDRRAIAGAIAWEAIENFPLRSISKVPVVGSVLRGLYIGASRSAGGPGKIHVREKLFSPFEGEPLSKQAEEAGHLPKQTKTKRKMILKKPLGAITYIAGMMASLVDMTETYGFRTARGVDPRCDPVLLSYLYQSQDFKKWEAHLKKKKPGEKLNPISRMADWVKHHMTYLEEAVGKPELPESCSR